MGKTRQPPDDLMIFSTFEFLDDEDSPSPAGPFAAPPGPPAGEHAAALFVPRPPPPLPDNPWEAMDVDYRPIPLPPTLLPWRALMTRHPSREILVQRTRLEVPVLLAWIVLSGCFPGFPIWIATGGAMLAFSFFMREPFELCGLQGQAGIYRAIGAGQLAVGIASIVSFGPFMPLLGIYALGVLLSWAFVEGRHLYRLEAREIRSGYPSLY